MKIKTDRVNKTIAIKIPLTTQTGKIRVKKRNMWHE